jgi:alginate O-acetyltransferase complex protein AlgI
LFATCVLLLPGLSLILHFGIFNVLAGLWRRVGADCRSLFRAPLHSTSLSEFWSKRWNLAFVEMATCGVFRPLKDVVGPRMATAAVFLYSGLLHELAISLSVRAGFGRPLLYFALHGVAVLCEKRLDRAGWSINRSVWLGRLWTAAWILLPLPLLFHPAFLRGCLLPLLGN